jgi:hypothetical protein
LRDTLVGGFADRECDAEVGDERLLFVEENAIAAEI